MAKDIISWSFDPIKLTANNILSLYCLMSSLRDGDFNNFSIKNRKPNFIAFYTI